MENKKYSSILWTIDEVPLRKNLFERSESDLNFPRKNQVNWRNVCRGAFKVIYMLLKLVLKILLFPFYIAFYIIFTGSAIVIAIVLTLAFMGFLISLIV